MKYETMKNFQLLFDKAAATGILNIYTIRKSAEEGEDYIPAKRENGWLGNQRDYHHGIYNIYNDYVNYSIQLTDWRYQDDYYVMVFDNNQKSTATIELKDETRNILTWRYKPCKRDGRNIQRKEIFARQYPDCIVDFIIPKSINELGQFCEAIIKVANLRKTADSLGVE